MGIGIAYVDVYGIRRGITNGDGYGLNNWNVVW